MFLLDANVFSGLRRLNREPEPFRRWANGMTPAGCFLSVIVLLELEKGVCRIERRDARQGEILRRWLEDRVLTEYDGRLLDIGTAVARRAAGLHVPDPRPAHDALIAATALVHGLTVVTRNVRDFAGLGVRLLNPWEPA